MSNQPTASDPSTDHALSSWDEIRRVADELELQVHLASMDARDRWQALEPRLTALGRWFERSGERVGEAITKELSAVGELIKKLRADVKPDN
jgi:hypothetical protein